MSNEINRLIVALTESRSNSLSTKLLGEHHTALKALSEIGLGFQSLNPVLTAFAARDDELRRLASGMRFDAGDVFSTSDIATTLNIVNGGSDFTRSLAQVLGTSSLRFDFAKQAEERMRLCHQQLSDVGSEAARPFAEINLNIAYELLRVSGGFHEYSALIDSVRSIALPTLDFDFNQRLGDAFHVAEFFDLRRLDDIQRYLTRTELPQEFIEAQPELVSSSLTDLGLVAPLGPRHIHNTTPRRFKANQSRRNALSLRELIEWFEKALRDKVDLVMKERAGLDWVRTLKTPATKGWVTRFDKKQTKVWISGYAPQREIESALFSEFLTFAFLSDDCAPLLLVEPSFPPGEFVLEISRLNEARTAVFHGFERASPHHLTITMGIVYKLAGAAGLMVPLTDADLEKDTAH